MTPSNDSMIDKSTGVDYQYLYDVDPKIFYVENTVSEQFHVDHLKQTFRDFARSNLYRIMFILPSNITANFNYISTENQAKTEVLAKAVNFPSFDITKMEIKRMGQRLYVPSSQNYGELQFTMLSDDAYTQRKFLHSWMNACVYSTETNLFRDQNLLKYCSIEVYQLDNDMKPIFGAEFTYCFPNSIGEIQMSYDSADQLTEFPVTFAYSQYNIITPNGDNDIK